MLTQEEINELRAYKDTADDVNIRFKEIIKQKLCANRKIIHCLDNAELDEDFPDEYLGVNILSRMIFPETQTVPKNYICFKVEFDGVLRDNPEMKNVAVTFTIWCDSKDVDDKETGIARHDLLASLVREEFQHSNCFGTKCVCTYDHEGISGTDYLQRMMVFKLTTPNSILKTTNGIANVINNRVRK